MPVFCPECQAENNDDSRFCRKCATPLSALKADDAANAPTLTFTPVSRELTPGTTFAGRYLVIEELGKGGMGNVYKVLDQEIHEKVSLKVIKPEIAADKATVERFQNEIKIARRISHKNICRMYHLGREKETLYITMEYVTGENLKNMIRMTKEMSLESTLSIAQQVCQGLSEAHRLGIVHRDLKPQNVMIDEEGNARIMDFGIARSLETKGATLPGAMIGTPEYMSPEQVDGREVDARSDIYSLGIILYEMMTGKTPFSGDTPWSVAFRHKNDLPGDPRELNPEIPESMSRVILKCLEKKKEKRYQTAAELMAALKDVEQEHIRTGTQIKAGMRTLPRRPLFRLPAKKFAAWTAAIVAVVALSVLAGKSVFRRTGAISPRDMIKLAVITFENQTGDKAYDYLQDAIPNLLITSLEQSKLFRITSWERLRDLIKQLGKEDPEVIDRDLGFELCRLDGVQAIVLGSFVKAGDTFATDAKVLDVGTKGLLKTVRAQGDGVDSIIKKQIDYLSNEIARGFGREEPVTRLRATPIAEVTTNSLEAYHSFLRGRDEYEKFYYDDARRSLEQAVAIDPDFVMAYSYLARVYMALGNSPAAEEALRNIQKSGSKVSGKEGLYIQALLANYIDKKPEKYFEILTKIVAQYPEEKRARVDRGAYLNATGKFEEAIAELRRALELDPRYGFALNLMAYANGNQGKYDQALKYFEQYAVVSPGDANPYDSMGELFFRMGKFDEAVDKFKEAVRIKPDFGSSYKISYIHALRENYDEALNWVDQYIANAPSNGHRSWGYQLKAIYYHLLGRTGLSRDALGKAQEYAEADKDAGNINLVYRTKIWMAYDLGKYDEFLKFAKERFDYRADNKIESKPLNEVIYKLYEGIFELKQNRLAAARAKLAEMDAALSKISDLPEKPTKNVALYHLSTEILAAEGKGDEAAAEFAKIKMAPIYIGNIASLIQRITPYIGDLPAQAYLRKGQREKAIAEYERLISPDPLARKWDIIHPLSRFRLAKLYEEKGERNKAIEQYEKLAQIWWDADPNFPEAQEVKSRLASLKAN